jgi:predicted O-methyltransferase YrrM
MNKLRIVIRYLRYLIDSKTRYRIHSPFVYDFINRILRDNSHYDDYEKLWKNRCELAESSVPVETVDFGSGAGEKQYSTKVLTLKQIVQRRSHPRKRLELLYRIARDQKPPNILEFGTSAGISTTYLKAGHPSSDFVTMEGCANLVFHAENSFKKLGFTNIKTETGNFDNILEKVLSTKESLDLVFFDGNHREEPTLRYYESCIKLSNESTIFVFDDIHWSNGMERAWNKIKSDPRVSITIDLFWFGLVFFRKNIEKQNFVIRY